MAKVLLLLCLFFHSFLLFSQVTISEITSSEEKSVLKPMPYDSLQNWVHHVALRDYKAYIGLQIYLPPIEKDVDKGFQYGNFLFSTRPSIIKAKERMIYTEVASKEINHIYDSIATFIYKPLQYSHSDSYGDGEGKFWVKIYSDSVEVSNTYFSILNVFYSNELDNILSYMNHSLDNLKKNQNIFVQEFDDEIENKPSYVFLVRNDKTNDSLYCFNTSNFIFVPYFVKQKQLYQNQVLIYDNQSFPMEASDIRYIIKTKNGDEYKKVEVERGSKWLCTEVTLLKPSYKMYFILKNDKDEQILLRQLDDRAWHKFMLEKDYIKRENEKKIQSEQLIANSKKEELIRIENEKNIFEKHKIECINKFGQENGELIAQGKVKIGMTTEMCIVAWGLPLWIKKITTESGVFENWYYLYGYSLHFSDGILKIIEE